MNTRVKAKLVDAAGFSRTITRIAHEIIERNRGTERLGLVGMQTRGVYIAKRVAAKIREIENIDVPVGVLDATLYRDDYRTSLRQPSVQQTEIPFDLYDMNVVMVDDVLYTGRPCRAAFDAIMGEKAAAFGTTSARLFLRGFLWCCFLCGGFLGSRFLSGGLLNGCFLLGCLLGRRPLRGLVSQQT